MKSLLSLAALVGLFSAVPINAQDVLDRTDPTQAEDEIKPQAQVKRDPAPATVIETAGRQGVARSTQVDVGAISVVGAQNMPVADFVDIVQRYSARTLLPADLARLTDDISGRARARGYVFARAWIEAQSLNGGVLRVHLDEGRIDRIRIVGGPDAAVRSQLEPLVSNEPVTLARLQRRIMLAEDVPGVAIRRTSFSREGDEGVLTIEMAHSRAGGFIDLENDGTRPIGPERVRLDVDFNGVLTGADQFSVTLATTPVQPQELRYGRAAYRVVANGSGTVVGISGSLSVTEPGAFLSDRKIFGQSWRTGVDVRHPLLRSRNFGLWAEGELELRDLRQERSETLVRRDRIPVARAGLFTASTIAGGRFHGRLTYSQGFALLGATRANDPRASRDDASARFSTLAAWADWERTVSGNFSVRLSGRGQLSSAPLLVAEDFGLGGSRYLRAYDYNERTGDEGIVGSGELRYDLRKPLKLLQNMQFYAYGDGGVVGNLAGGRGGGSLASVGGGFRANITRRLGFDVELAVPVTGPRYDTGDKAPHFAFRVRQAF